MSTMKRDTIGRSRVFFDGLLPGNLYRIRHTLASGRVVGVRDNREDSIQVDEGQLVSVATRLVKEWSDLPGCKVEMGLLQALEQPQNKIVVISPGEITITPFPMMVRCSVCRVLDYHQANMSDEDKLVKAVSRLRKQGNRVYLPCKRTSCSGHMVQVPYVAVHRCGHLDQIDISPRDWGIPNLGLKDAGSSFRDSTFFDVDTGITRSRALQAACSYCRKIHGDGVPGLTKRGTPVGNQDKFYPQNIQYLCLNADTGKIISRAQAMLGSSGTAMSDPARDIAEGVASALVRATTSEDLMQHFQTLFKGEGRDEAKIESLHTQLAAAQQERKKMTLELDSMAGVSDDMRKLVLTAIDDKIARLQGELARASGQFSAIRTLIPDDETLHEIAACRRSMESVFLEYDFRKQRDTLTELTNREADPLRREDLLDTARLLQTSYGIKEVLHYKEVNVVMASIGYTREKFKPGEDHGEVPLTLTGYEDQQQDALQSKRIFYALPAKTEGIQVRLDPRKVLNWWVDALGVADPGEEVINDEQKARAYLLRHCPALSMDPSEVIRHCKDRPLQESAPFHLLHSISHVLMANIKRHTGYSDKSVMEYLLPMDLSILLYVTSVQNYTAGGLHILFKHYLRHWFDDASNYALNCMLDPFCSDKGSSCSRCVQIVIGCETFNHGLSRSFIHGGKTGIDNQVMVRRGYWF